MRNMVKFVLGLILFILAERSIQVESNDQKTLTVNLSWVDHEGSRIENDHVSKLATKLDKNIPKKEIYEVDIVTRNYRTYYGTLWFYNESPPKKLQLIFDTGSSWFWVSADGCEGCPHGDPLPLSQIYNCKEEKSLEFGDNHGSINGNICMAKVSITDDPSQAIKDFKLLAIKNSTVIMDSLSQWSGVVGLLPSKYSETPSFLTELKNQKIISNAMFSVRFIDTEYGSEMTFGGFNNRIANSIDNFTFTPLFDDRYWSVGIRRIKYGDVEIGGAAICGIIDTGSPMILLPAEDYDRWYGQVSKGKTCGSYKQYQGCYCLNVNDFKNIYIMLNNYEYTVTPSHYIEKTMYNNKVFCYFLVGKSHESGIPSAILGDAFIRNYYILFDSDKERVGIFGSNIKYYPSEVSMRAQLIFIVCILCFVIASTVLYFYKRAIVLKKESELEKLIAAGIQIED